MASPDNDSHVFHPQDLINETAKTTLIMGGAGLFASTVQNTLQKRNVGPMGVFTLTGKTIGTVAAVGGAYQFAKTASGNLRQKDDLWNSVTGGFFGGAMLGLRARSMVHVVGKGVALAAILGVFEYCGGRLSGWHKPHEEDEFERRRNLATNYRTPVDQTVSEIGERRGKLRQGIAPPGYLERRQQRIKENYGIEVPLSQASTQP
ncbi:hypothetical protein KEM52_001748 [Ascosphaera acerosa]|nr:hypothetical protein KEM52_001748 [Ascosphaera acerosa]